MNPSLDDPQRESELARTIQSKPALRRLYVDFYQHYKACLDRCPQQGIALELGSGAGFVKEVLPEMVTSDIIEYKNIDRVVDGMNMPFDDGELRAITMLNTLHHIPDAGAFFREAERCLMPGGRVLIIDQHPGWISRPILTHVHHEPFDMKAEQWQFETTGPLSGANGALAWIIFQRDRAKFARDFPQLHLERYEPHTPLRYWLAGGLKNWSLLPAKLYHLARKIDTILLRFTRQAGSFVAIEIVKKQAAT